MHPSVSIIIPSRLAPVHDDDPDRLWLQNAIASVQQQSVCEQVEMEIVVGIDHGMSAPNGFENPDFPLLFVPAPSNSTGQAAAVNEAVGKSRGQYLAFLEDDDRWHPNFLGYALEVITEYDFVSSNQLEILPDGPVLRVVDFPTPTAWFMRRELWEQIGGFDTEYLYHFDNDWLGRLTNAEKRRIHLVEVGAPRDIDENRTNRSDLDRVRGVSVIGFHGEDVPLVTRTENLRGGMTLIRTTSDAASRSQQEYARLTEIYGCVPC